MKKILIHPLYVRIFHWVNAIAIVVMITSGWQIYNASPVFSAIAFPRSLTLGGWLGGGIQWHLSAMWLFTVNLAIYLLLGIFTGHFKAKFFPLGPKALISDISQALRGRLAHDSHEYNAVQKLSYVGVIFAMVLTFTSGLVVWKSVQFQTLGLVFGGYDGARIVHFVGMSLICAFIIVHLALVLIVPSTFLPMITGKAKPFPKSEKDAQHVA